jgi:seryl-tRNA synthetase
VRERTQGPFSIELPSEPEGDLADDIRKQGAYASPHVRRVEVVGRRVAYDLCAGAPADVHEKMRRYLHRMVARYRKIPRKIIHTRARTSMRPLEKNVFEQLQARRWVTSIGSGQVSLAGPALNALRVVDDDARRLAVESFGAREEVYPSLIPTEALGRCGYFSSFPQSLSMVIHLVEDFDIIEAFRSAHAEDTTLGVMIEPTTFAPPNCCLSPALCYHCYLNLQGTRLTGPPHVVTTAGKCFRYESINMTGIERLWEFTMREVVFMGTEDEVVERRARGLELVKAQLEKWDLAGQIETANDPFFGEVYANKSYAQRRNELKFELRLPLGDEASPTRDLACASFNLHDNFFGRTFSIETKDGKPAFTGCVGWGLERWVLALFTQHGLEPGGWPEALRSAVWS